MVTVHDKCLVKVEMALNLWVKDMNTECVLSDRLHVALNLYSLQQGPWLGVSVVGALSRTRTFVAGYIPGWACMGGN